MSALQNIRETDGAKLDESGRYYITINNIKRFGYFAHFSGAYVCYTCGHLCECGENCGE